MKVKLLSNVTADSGATLPEGSVVELPDAQAQKLIELGAAEASDSDVTVEAPQVQQEVGTTTTDPLPDSAQVGQPEQAVSQPQPPAPEATTPDNQPPTTPQQPVSSETISPNLHLG